MFFVIIVWVVLSLVIGSAAGQRGRSAFGWFLLSILTTPLLAGIFLLLFPPLRDLTLSVDDEALQESISKGLSIETPRKRGIGRLIVVLAILSFIIVAIPTINNMANKSPTTTAKDRDREAEAAEMAARERHAAIVEEATRNAAARAAAPNMPFNILENTEFLDANPDFVSTTRKILEAKGFPCPNIAMLLKHGVTSEGAQLEIKCAPHGSDPDDYSYMHYMLYSQTFRIKQCKWVPQVMLDAARNAALSADERCERPALILVQH
jgi:Na+-transporting methylmalonyl-CoA/oxaloacetate decarboxylase gamma subunit